MTHSPAHRRRASPLLAALQLSALLLLPACGGGGGPDQVAGVSSGGTGNVGGGKPTALVGQVSAQGVVVNGVRVDTDASTTVTDMDGNTLDASALQPGVTVVVDGGTTEARGDGMHSQALRVQVRGLLLGQVQSVNAAQRSLRLMDHTVVLDAEASIDGQWARGLADVQNGDLIEVYGWQDAANQRYVATRIARRTLDASTTFRVTGLLADLTLTPGDEHCAVGTQAIAYAWPGAPLSLANGQWVRGQIYNLPTNEQGRWSAINMATAAPWLTDKAQISLDGLITKVAPGGLKLDVQGWPVLAQPGSCTLCATLKVGDHVRVLGSLVQGTVEAVTITTAP